MQYIVEFVTHVNKIYNNWWIVVITYNMYRCVVNFLHNFFAQPYTFKSKLNMTRVTMCSSVQMKGILCEGFP